MEAETPIVMPKLGLTMTEGVLAEWRVKEGDIVAPGQILFVVETEKISNEVEAPTEGRVTRLIAKAGETLNVGATLALWARPGGGAAAQAPNSAPEAAPLRERATRLSSPRILSTPLARRLALSSGIDLTGLTGTGPRGRIQARDIEEAVVRSRSALAPAPREGQAVRRLIAERLTRSKREIPHFYVTAEVRFDALMAVRNELNAGGGRKLTVTPFLVIAAARALKLDGAASVFWRDGGVIAAPRSAIGVAVETTAGVMVPVIDAEGGIYEVADALDGAVARARAGKLRAGDVGDAAISISNVGMFGVRALTPIIDPEQTYILGVGAPQRVLRPDANDAPRAVSEVTLTLACDHRAVDGGVASRFLAAIVTGLENPLRLVVGDRPAPR